MTRDDIVQMAWDCGILMRSQNNQEEPTKLEKFAALIEARVREECAIIAEEYLDDPYLSGHGYATGCARAIREGNEK